MGDSAAELENIIRAALKEEGIELDRIVFDVEKPSQNQTKPQETEFIQL